MKETNKCFGCHLYSQLCIVVRYKDEIKCPCWECLFKVTCLTISQSCDEYQAVIQEVHNRINDEDQKMRKMSVIK